MFPVAPARAGLPSGYAGILRDLKQRIQQERLRTVMAANSAMVILYWDIGRTILARQSEEGWGARVIDRLSTDLREAFPDMYGLSPRNLIYMRAFAAAWPDRAIVQQLAAQIPWFHNCTENQSDSPTRRGTGQGFHCAPSRPVSFNDQAYGRKQSGPWKNGASRVAESATKVEHGTFMA
ncbi:MAG: hypothetical protein HYR55_17190 [Acidobacteria bacterium]|nr:hypothetical protein [Acidobacteriota bacterium]